MKKCPYCAEEIQDAAVKCRFCGEYLDEPPDAEPTFTEKSSRLGTIAIVGLVAFLGFRHGIPFLRSGGLHRAVGLLYVANLTVELPSASDEAASEASKIIIKRVRDFSGHQPETKLEGRKLSIRARGVSDADKLKELLRAPGVLEVRLVDDSPTAQKALAASVGGKSVTPPSGDVLAPGRDGEKYLLARAGALSGLRVRSAKLQPTASDLNAVLFQLDGPGSAAFAQLTAGNLKRRLAIMLDGQVYSAPIITGRIEGGSAMISGHFNPEAARELAIVLGSGPLPTPVEIKDEPK